MSGMELLLDGNRGVYIPRYFADIVNSAVTDGWSGIDEEDLNIISSGPDHEHYWDAWDSVMSRAKFTDSKGNDWHLYQDGDLWLYCESLMTDNEYEDFFGEVKP